MFSSSPGSYKMNPGKIEDYVPGNLYEPEKVWTWIQ